MVRLKIAHKLLICGAAITLSFAVLFYCAVAGLESRALRTSLITFSLALLALAAGFLVIAVRNLTRALAGVKAVAVELADGGLQEAEKLLREEGEGEALAAWQVDYEASELRRALRELLANLNSPLKQVHRTSEEVTDSSNRIAESLKRLETYVAGQGASTNEAIAVSREICATTQKLLGTMGVVQQMASEAASLASAGLENLNGISSTMREHFEASEGMSSALNTISERVAAITPVISTITNVANRTNLISLNASIEAEKAGEHAAGFSVVALEIRRLADQTAVTALDIEKMIGELRAAVNEGAAGMSRHSAQTRNCLQTVAGITGGLSRLIDYTRRLEPHIEAVNRGMQEQTRAAGQVLKAVQQVAEVAGQTCDSLAGFRQNADKMRSAAQMLQGETGRFSVGA